jgi:hypothetical protein
MKEDNKRIKVISLRMPHDLWHFFKLQSINQETSLTELIIKCLYTAKEKSQKKVDNK